MWLALIRNSNVLERHNKRGQDKRPMPVIERGWKENFDVYGVKKICRWSKTFHRPSADWCIIGSWRSHPKWHDSQKTAPGIPEAIQMDGLIRFRAAYTHCPLVAVEKSYPGSSLRWANKAFVFCANDIELGRLHSTKRMQSDPIWPLRVHSGLRCGALYARAAALYPCFEKVNSKAGLL